ncbi:hypothetical protein BC830DRAFT_419786 [Chytriomyces sp. MP71]|nr:hypothetical protein BC830DRAFT_419786 [Chytriomyces sp. MP71]
MKLEIDHMEHLLEQARIRLSRAFEQWYEEVHLATCKISPSASPAPPMHTEDSSSRESDFGRVSAIISSNSASSVAPTSLTLENNQRPRSALDERVSNIRKAHTAFISNSASPYSSTSTLFLNDPSPRPSASPSVEMMDRKPPPVASLSLAGGAGWTSQAPRLSCPGRSMSSLSYSVTTLQNQSPRVHSASSSRPLTPAISSTLRPLKGVGEGMIDKSVESDIAAFYEAREGLLRSKGVPKNTSSFIGRLFDKQQQ